MKRIMRSKLFITSLLSVAIWNVSLTIGSSHFNGITFVLGLFVCGLLPGLLSVIALGAKRLSLQTLLYSIGLSYLFMIIVGLSANYIPQLFGVERPLSLRSIQIAYNVWLLIVFAWGANNNNGLPRITGPRLHFHFRTVLIYLLAIVGVAASIFGTFRLNNGADNFLSSLGLCLVMVNAALVLLWRRHLPTHAYIIAIAGLSWSLLLLTSLRSNFISGQDLKQEFRVYNITQTAGYWSIANFRDSYNACLSITLYPVVLVKLLGVSAAVVFKLLIQLLFVACPLAVFALARSRVGRNFGFLAAIFFLSLPTLGLDLPLQTRQQIAFLLFSLVTLTWFHHTEAWIRRHWHILFVLFSFGVIVSHYSTSYIYVGTLLLFYIVRSLFLTTRYARRRELARGFTLTGRMVLLVTLFGFFWLSQITATTANLFDKLGSSISNLTSDNAAVPEQTAAEKLLSGSANPLSGYVRNTKTSDATVTADTLQQIRPIDDTLPPAKPLQTLPTQIQSSLKLVSQKLYYAIGIAIFPIIILIGLFSLMLRRKSLAHRFEHRPEYLLLSAAILIVIVVQALLPGIMNDYGITRVFIQAFIILVIPFMFGIKELLRILDNRYTRFLVVFGAFTLFATYSGLTGQILGGTRPQLNLNNAGPYYGAFYVRRGDIASYQWIQTNIRFPGNVNAPDYSFPTALAYFPDYKHYGGGIFPFQETPDHYALLNYPQTHDKVTYTSGSVLAVPFDQRIFNQKNVLYTNSDSTLFR